MENVITTKATAQMARTILKEAFPGIKFSVKSKRSTHTPVMDIDWQDGPTEDQVKAYIDRLCGTFYDTSGRDHRRRRRQATVSGQTISFEPEIIFYNRTYSDQAIARAITAYVNCHHIQNPALTVAGFRTGKLYLERSEGADWNCEQEIRFLLQKRSVMMGNRSPLAAQIAVIPPVAQPQPAPRLDLDKLAEEITEAVQALPLCERVQAIQNLTPKGLGVIKTEELNKRINRRLIRTVSNVVYL